MSINFTFKGGINMNDNNNVTEKEYTMTEEQRELLEDLRLEQMEQM